MSANSKESFTALSAIVGSIVSSISFGTKRAVRGAETTQLCERLCPDDGGRINRYI